MSVTLSVTVKDRVADWTPSVYLPQIYCGTNRIDYVKFILDEEWDTFTGVKVLFSDGTEAYEVKLDDHNVAEIPSRITEKPCFMKIGVFGIDDNEKIITSSILVYQIGKGASTKTFLGDTAFKSLNEKLEQCLKIRSFGDIEAQFYLSDSAIVTYDESKWQTIPQVPTQSMPYLWARYKFLYQNGEFDMTEPVIISGKGDKGEKGDKGDPGSIDNLPIADVKVLGGVMPVRKSDAMGLPVGVDEQGRLWSTGGEVTATFKNGDTVAETEKLLSGMVPTFSGKNLTDSQGRPFDHWVPALTSITKDTTFTAVFKHKVTYFNNDGSETVSTEYVSDGEYPRLIPNIVNASGEKHTGWSKTVNASAPQTDALDAVTSDVNLYATFESTFHSVTPSEGETTVLSPDVFYAFGEVSSLAYSLTGGTQGKEWRFSFISPADTATMVTHPADVEVGDFEVEPNGRVEVSILQDGVDKFLLWKEWSFDE